MTKFMQNDIEKEMHLKLIQHHCGFQIGMYFDFFFCESRFLFCASKFVEDAFWNFGLISDPTPRHLEKDFTLISQYAGLVNRKPALYLPFHDQHSVELSETLKKMNLTAQYRDAWMATEIEEVIRPHANSAPKLEIVEVLTEDHKAAFLRIFRSVYMSPAVAGEPYSGLPEAYFKAINQSVINAAPFVHHLIGSFEGEVIAAGTICSAIDTAAIYNVAVLPQFRRRGFGAEISVACINRAAAAGKNITLFLQTEAGSENEVFYQKLGFKTIFLAECFA